MTIPAHTFALGQRFVIELRSPWGGRDDTGQRITGTEITTARIRISRLYGDQFHYVVEETIAVVDPLPNVAKRHTITTGGMTYDYAASLLATGTLLRLLE